MRQFLPYPAKSTVPSIQRLLISCLKQSKAASPTPSIANRTVMVVPASSPMPATLLCSPSAPTQLSVSMGRREGPAETLAVMILGKMGLTMMAVTRSPRRGRYRGRGRALLCIRATSRARGCGWRSLAARELVSLPLRCCRGIPLCETWMRMMRNLIACLKIWMPGMIRLFLMLIKL